MCFACAAKRSPIICSSAVPITECSTCHKYNFTDIALIPLPLITEARGNCTMDVPHAMQ